MNDGDVQGDSAAERGAAGSDPVAEAAGALDLGLLLRRARARLPRQPDIRDLLPPDDVDLDRAKATILVSAPANFPAKRRNMADQLVRLQIALKGQPEILLWHALAISYLRRDTPHTDRARRLFFRIWDSETEFMLNALNARWLVSSLQSFADHGRSEAERLAGSAGFLYGNLIKVYESEINSAFRRRKEIGPFKGAPVKGLFGFQPGHDILRNINIFAMAQADADGGPAGLALMRLMAHIRDGSTIFDRTDALIADPDFPSEGGYLSWGENLKG